MGEKKYYSIGTIEHTDCGKTTITELFNPKEFEQLIETVEPLYTSKRYEEIEDLLSTVSEDKKELILFHLLLKQVEMTEKEKEEKLLESLKSLSDEIRLPDPIEFSDNPIDCSTNPIYKINNTHINNKMAYHPNDKTKTKKRYPRRLP